MSRPINCVSRIPVLPEVLYAIYTREKKSLYASIRLLYAKPLKINENNEIINFCLGFSSISMPNLSFAGEDKPALGRDWPDYGPITIRNLYAVTQKNLTVVLVLLPGERKPHTEHKADGPPKTGRHWRFKSYEFFCGFFPLLYAPQAKPLSATVSGARQYLPTF